MGIVAYIEFNGEHEQAQSSARRMSYQTVARNYAKESGNQTADNACFIWSVVAALHPAQNNRTEILVSISSKSRGHRISNDIESNSKL